MTPKIHKGPGKPLPLVVGNPAIPVSAAQYILQPMIGVEKEANFIADLLESKPITGQAASKEHILKKLPMAEYIHLATNISWNDGEIVLAPRLDAISDSEDSDSSSLLDRIKNKDGADSRRKGVTDGDLNSLPDPHEYLLTISEIMNMKLVARLVVFSGAHHSKSPQVTANGLLCMAQAFLTAEAECVVVPLWPVSYQASYLIMNAFYSSLLDGSKTSKALCYAMQVGREVLVWALSMFVL